MRFRRLDLIRYGKFTNHSIELPVAQHDFHLIVGPNEAGKSTLRSAILDLLFNFPVRTPLDFLHPKSDLRLGALIENSDSKLEFQRAKANKQSLRTVTDSVLPDSALLPFLDSADRKFFDQMFALDHQRLVDGGNSILSAENDVGQVLFQSAAGVASLGKIRDALEKEASELWAPRKSADRAYYIASAELEKATASLKQATVRTKEWADASNQVEKLADALERERASLRGLAVRRGRLERVRRLAPFLMSVRDCEGQLSALGEVVELPEDAAKIYDAAERDLATSQKLLEIRKAEIVSAQGRLSEIQVDEAILALETDVTLLDEMRQQYSAYDRDIERRQSQVDLLWKNAIDDCNELGWTAESEDFIASRIPSILVRREIDQLAREQSGLVQALKSAERAEKAKQSEIIELTNRLEQLPKGEVKPELRAALASARSHGELDTATRKLQAAVSMSKASLDKTLSGLGVWQKSIVELDAMHVPAAQTLSLLIQERQTLLADRKSAENQQRDQKTLVEKAELEVSQYKEAHHPTTGEDVAQARNERDEAWRSIKTGDVTLQHGSTLFEASIRHADNVADTRLDKAEEASELQSRRHQLEREKQTLIAYNDECIRLSNELWQFDARWTELTENAGLRGMPIDSITDWLIKREKAFTASEAYDSANRDLNIFSDVIAESKARLIKALTDTGLHVSQTDNLSVLCEHAESLIKEADKAGVRRTTLSEQLGAASTLVDALKQDARNAESDLTAWQQSWSSALKRAGLSEDSDVGTAGGALELITRIDETLGKMRQIRVERIETMQADLKRFASEATRLAALTALEVLDRPAAEIAKELASRLSLARGEKTEIQRIKGILNTATSQAQGVEDTIQATTASLTPLLERAGVDTYDKLLDEISRSDNQRRLNAQLFEAKQRLLNDGDGLTREQIAAEIDAEDMSQLPIALGQLNQEFSDVVDRQTSFSADHANASQALSKIAGTDTAARAEAQRQEALSRMSDASERYVKVYTAARLLRWSIDRYREEKQGPMLARAGAIFSRLTLGSFQRLIVDYEREPMALEGQRADGKPVRIDGMSDGTRDQLYLALRLSALELHLEQAPPLPFIADDLFINYDDDRAKAGLEALAALSQQTQVVFLSHHDHLVPTVREVFGDKVNVVVL